MFFLPLPKCRRRCLEIESSLEKFNIAISPLDSTVSSPFPVVIGRRPTGANTPKQPHFKGPLSSICLTQLVVNANAAPAPGAETHQRSSSRYSEPVFVPSIGWVSQPSPEELQVQFNDGARLVVVYSTATVHCIRYQSPASPDGPPGKSEEEQTYYMESSTSLPAEVRSRLEVIPKVVKCLRSRSKTPS